MRELKPVRESREDYEDIEAYLISLFKKEIYLPLLKELEVSGKALTNAVPGLHEAIRTGRISYYRGQFKGRFNSVISRELKAIGAKWDRKQGSWTIPLSSLPQDVKHVISVSQSTFDKVLEVIDRKLASIFPPSVSLKDMFSSTLFRADQSVNKTLKSIVVEPRLTKERRERIAEEYEQNMQKYISDFTEKEIVKLRKSIRRSVLKGERYESIIEKIKKSYGVTHAKAKFLARQETSLMVNKFKEVKYQEAGVMEYKWRCVVGSPNHPVRPEHKKLDGKIFRFDDPPVTSETGAKNNPGEDYNCRCIAIPVVRF